MIHCSSGFLRSSQIKAERARLRSAMIHGSSGFLRPESGTPFFTISAQAFCASA
jgi:hypothetical protein